MNRALQLRLSGMTLEEFKEWHGVPVNAESLPVLLNSRWLEHQSDPVGELYKSVQNWAEKYPYPTPEQLAELQSKNLWKR